MEQLTQSSILRRWGREGRACSEQGRYCPRMDWSRANEIMHPSGRLTRAEREAQELARASKEIERVERKIKRFKRDYPLHVCSNCHHIDGWVDAKEGAMCLHCLTIYPFFLRVEEPLRYHPLLHGMILGRLERYRLQRELNHLSSKRPPLWSRLLKLLGAKRPYELRVLRNWQRFISDWDESPPLGSEVTVWGAEKFETLSPHKDERLIIFKCGWYWFQGGRWVRRKNSPYPFLPSDTGSVFSATLPIEQLVSAWADFQEAVRRENVRDWKDHDRYKLEDRERKALDEQKATDKQDLLRAQEGVADLF
jgi:hypothetical protein